MYSHCIFCSRDLGSNETIEQFPVGRRLAFDSERGRLWVVCRRCERWNLTPIEERWEAIEDCERRFRATAKRVSTEHIGWARLADGFDLIRVGRPLLPEFAGWRYGRMLGRRRAKYVVRTGAGAGVIAGGAAVALSSSAVIVGMSGILAMVGANMVLGAVIYRASRGPAPIPRMLLRSDTDEILSVAPAQSQLHAVRPDRSGEGWRLDVEHAEGSASLHGPAAIQALAQLLPRYNKRGASRRDLKEAIAEVQRVGDSHQYLADLPKRWEQRWTNADTLAYMPDDLRLALEIAANEDAERRALDGQLARLEQAWRDAEEIASIADDLLAPDVSPSEAHPP